MQASPEHFSILIYQSEYQYFRSSLHQEYFLITYIAFNTTLSIKIAHHDWNTWW